MIPTLRTRSDLFEYQDKASNFQCTHFESMLWLDMGLGKTVITLSSVEYLIRIGFLRGVLIVAPIRVCRMVWRQEALKWQHTLPLQFSLIVGTRDQRSRALLQPAHVYLINYENLRWLTQVLQRYFIKTGRQVPFDGLVMDEITKCKNSTTKRVKEFKTISPIFKWKTGLTGSPASNGYKDLHGQYLLLDGGRRLGTAKTAFMNRFYKKEGYKDIALNRAEEEIKALIGDITMEMSAADYNPLPDLITNDIFIEMSKDLQEQYQQLENEFFLALDSGVNIEVFNAAAMTNKCLQFANGAIYPEPGNSWYESVHELKLEALEEIISECNGKPVLCAYAYRSDAERIMTKFKALRPINLTECKSQKQLENAMHRWTTGDCPLMIGHPASMGHGVDGLQAKGHHLVWFGLNWSLDLYDQFNARIRRQGQGMPVICHRILAPATLDMVVAEALQSKAGVQTSLRAAIKNYRISKGV